MAGLSIQNLLNFIEEKNKDDIKKNFVGVFPSNFTIESEPIKGFLSDIFHRIEATVEKEEFVNLFCSSGIIQIDGRRLLLGKIAYFKDVIILFDSLDEVVCHGYNTFFINAHICSGKVLLPSSFAA